MNSCDRSRPKCVTCISHYNISTCESFWHCLHFPWSLCKGCSLVTVSFSEHSLAWALRHGLTSLGFILKCIDSEHILSYRMLHSELCVSYTNSLSLYMCLCVWGGEGGGLCIVWAAEVQGISMQCAYRHTLHFHGVFVSKGQGASFQYWFISLPSHHCFSLQPPGSSDWQLFTYVDKSKGILGCWLPAPDDPGKWDETQFVLIPKIVSQTEVGFLCSHESHVELSFSTGNWGGPKPWSFT